MQSVFFINTSREGVVEHPLPLNNNNLLWRLLMPNIIYNYHYTYLITNTTNQMKYIGVRSCSVLPENDSDYMGSSKSLDEAMNNTPEAFTKIIIETFSTRENANADEQRLHEMYDVARNPEFYNLCIAPMGFCMAGRTHSDETRKKMSKKRSPETRAKMSAAMMGRIHSPETRKKLSDSHKGKTLSEEHKKKMSDSKMGKTPSEETRAKMSESQRGRKHSEETLAKMSISQSGEKHHNYGKSLSEEHKKNLSKSNSGEKNAMYGKSHSEKIRKKISESKMGKSLSEEHKKKLSKATSGENNPMYGKKHTEESIKNMSGPPKEKVTQCVTFLL